MIEPEQATGLWFDIGAHAASYLVALVLGARLIRAVWLERVRGA